MKSGVSVRISSKEVGPVPSEDLCDCDASPVMAAIYKAATSSSLERKLTCVPAARREATMRGLSPKLLCVVQCNRADLERAHAPYILEGPVRRAGSRR